MSSFNPTQWTLHPPDRPDHLAAGVMQSLSRSIIKSKPWTPLKTLVLGGLTFGVLPLLVWPKRFGEYAIAEQQQFWHLVEWLRVRTRDADAPRLKQSVRNTGARISVWMIPMVLLTLIVSQFLIFAPEINFHELVQTTYAFPHPFQRLKLGMNGTNTWYLFKVWTIGLAVAYAFHWQQVRQHALDVSRMVGKINELLAKENVEPVVTPSVGIGLRRPVWALVGFIGIVGGAWWALPAALAGGLQSRYIYRTGPWVRSQLSQRVRSLLLNHRPAMNVPLPVRFRLACPNARCRAGLPDGAVFCSRCGQRVAAAVNRIA